MELESLGSMKMWIELRICRMRINIFGGVLQYIMGVFLFGVIEGTYYLSHQSRREDRVIRKSVASVYTLLRTIHNAY
jgi:membrane protein YqaA with SNARE-associated domain